MSVTNISSYEDLLYEMQTYRDEEDNTYPLLGEIITDSKHTYEVDLDARTINIPTVLSTQYDHNAEILYFKCPRYYENIDLSQMTCVIEYLNAEHVVSTKTTRAGTKINVKGRDTGIFWVPYFDLSHHELITDDTGAKVVNSYMYIPWSIQGLATAYPGEIEFVLRFYKLQCDDPTATEKSYSYIFNMSTKPQSGEILYGLDIDEEDLKEFNLDTTITAQIYDAMRVGDANSATYWQDV